MWSSSGKQSHRLSNAFMGWCHGQNVWLIIFWVGSYDHIMRSENTQTYISAANTYYDMNLYKFFPKSNQRKLITAIPTYNKIKLFSFLPVWPDWAIFYILGNFLKPLATINLPQSSPFLGNLCKDVKIYHFSSEIIFGQFL